MGQTIKSTTVSSSTVENAELASGFHQGETERAGIPPAVPGTANFGTITTSVSGNRLSCQVTAGSPTSGATVTILHGLGVAPRAVAVVPISQTNDVQARVLPASITSTQFVMSVAIAPSGVGTWIFEFVIFP